MQDIEFTIQEGKLYLLQTRSGKRAAAAAVGVAVDLVRESVIDQHTALLRVPPRSEEHTSELQSRLHLVCRLLLEKKKKYVKPRRHIRRRPIDTAQDTN